jgi:hypothetical protein
MCSLAFNLQFFTRCATYEFAFGISFDYQHVFIFFSVKKTTRSILVIGPPIQTVTALDIA